MSVSKGGGVALQHFATSDAAAVSNDSIITGRSAVGNAFTFPNGDTLRWTPRYADAAASGDLGFTVGSGTYFSAQAKRNFYSKYLTIWRKQQNAEWRWVADLGNSQPPP